MGSVDRDEERSFKDDNFSGEGVAKLREIVSEKLKEFMGDDTDDTLVEYVIVLLRNGRKKREAKTELNVFLGKDDSDSFVSWLWDHLSSTLELYVQPAEENHADKAVKTMLSMGKRAGRDESPNHIDCELEKGKTESLAGNRHRREWKGLERDPTEPPPLRSSVVVVRSDEKTHHKSSRRRKSLSPDPPQQKKRSRHEEHHMKRESVSQAASAAPRRLLQSAVRDAVGNLRQPVVVKEPSHNRLRSVVSASSEGLPLEDPPRRRRLQSFATVPNPMASVIKAVQEAADDVRRVKSSGSVFGRLGHGVDISETGEQVAEFRDASIAEEGYEEFNQEQAHPEFLQRIDRGGYVRNLSSMDCETGLASDLVSENEGYNVGHGAFRVSQIGTSGGSKGGDSFGVKYSASSYLDGPLPTANTSSKTVTVSSHVDARKPLHYQQDTRNATEIDISKPIRENEAEHGKSDVRLMKENGNLVVVSNGNAKPPDIQSESPKTQPSLPGSYTAGRPSEDADSRTIFVCNVHFAATKDSLSRHFNKFGEVLKVVIVTDASTGQPKGSAYVEFMRKESADNALSLDNTSFMSRILKITKRSSSNQEAPPVMTWPHVARGSPYAAARFARAPFPRGIPGAFRARAPMRMGTRSFQWKRDTQPATDDAAAVPGNTLVSPNSRGLTYVRPESKPDGSTGTT